MVAWQACSPLPGRKLVNQRCVGLQKAEDKAGLAGPNMEPDPEDGDDPDLTAPKIAGMDANDGKAL